MPSQLEKRLANLKRIEEKRDQAVGEVVEARKRQYIPCEGCDRRHQIGTLTAVQTHGYVGPTGHGGGDYWVMAELQFICPTTGVRNRLLINNDDVPWEDRKNYDNDPEAQFRRNYGPAFAEVLEEKEERTKYPWKNNHYVDKNRKKFGLVEKRE